MKRKTMLTICMLVLMLCLCTGNVFAMDQDSEKAVEGKTVFSLGNHTYISEIVNGRATVLIEDGTRINLTGEGMSGLYLYVVKLVEGADDYQWLAEELKNEGVLKKGYAVLFMDETGEFVTPKKPFTVILHFKEERGKLYGWHVEPNGQKTELSLIPEKDGYQTMGTKPNYYALVQDNGGSAGIGSAAKTGDITSYTGWGLLVLLSLSALSLIGSMRKADKTEQGNS